MRYVLGEYNETNSLKSRIIVSAGGAGSTFYISAFIQGGHAGGINGFPGSQYVYISSSGTLTNSTGANNILGGISGLADDKNSSSIINGSFGIGANPFETGYGSGGGGGYYGGGAGNSAVNTVGTGSGGSSFISGYKGCNAISEKYTLSNPIHTGKPEHYSGFVFANPIMKDGPTIKYIGNGQARITVLQNIFIREKSCNYYYTLNHLLFCIFIIFDVDLVK
ncbi:hypothetical protein TVAG_412390 [Trichomonas vaginalis G3]|uniref:receptor protein-tyrosine kinase n=1 Tax=Trichomonas vaginalis (strain ATCC PRA-98 / G3) TaxID=412133 RepID=A2EV52_TRIV3|nr:glycine-rich protein family [Trichomonas vaginalis G3]EAY03435.1 hypothetical protein TVAG_412390 [Trichomonas vaginalis G3]KAI5486164.1 glycine-rich protein family [Trichomonas vaginalis G3]|eukprot:XP_001315658.1 hypothetical protein [Trichomonas vaginalis G3]